MRAIDGFVLGAIAGAVTVWFWKREIEDYVEEKTRGVRKLAVAGIQAVEEGAGNVCDKGEAVLHRAEDLLADRTTPARTARGTDEAAIRSVPAREKRTTLRRTTGAARGGFAARVAGDHLCGARSFLRRGDDFVTPGGCAQQHIQKALNQMNLNAVERTSLTPRSSSDSPTLCRLPETMTASNARTIRRV